MAHPQLIVGNGPAGWRWLRLHRPERRNALDVSLTLAIRDALAAEPSVPVLLGSADPQVFCAGADLSLSGAERAAVSDLIYDCCQSIVTRPGPVIAVLTGAAVGGGAQLAASCDLRIAGPAARLRWTGPPGVNLTVGAWLLPDLVGRGLAMDLVLTGRWVEAAEALALGLVSRVSAEPAALAEEIAAGITGRSGASGNSGAFGFSGVKSVMAAGELIDRLQAERAANRAAWARAIPPGPSVPKEAEP
ncbi:MAG: enoyl-CoA hydratase/isomerase family protein [Actinomycetota bacterium]|nr:enoyl-CoA hydratase/isomerase family protein [Actinomycetota bacterium]